MKAFALALLLIFVLRTPADLSSCGPFLPVAVFYQRAPGSDRAFYSGNLGILTSRYDRAHLAMAYRILRGEALDAKQVDDVTGMAQYRAADVSGDLKEWMEARKAVPGAPDAPDPVATRNSDFFTVTVNCGSGAFATARATLRERIEQAGATSAEVKDWLAAQDRVFGNCGGPSGLPDAAPAAASERIRADRNYQIAAAEFYSGRYEEARAGWRAMAADRDSPWRLWASYLTARSYLREGKYEEARAALEGVLRDPGERPLQAQARQLLEFVLGKLEPREQIARLAARLMAKDSGTLGRDLSDFTFLFDRLEGGSETDYRPGTTEAQMQGAAAARMRNLNETASKNDLLEWIVQYQNRSASTHDAMERWHGTSSLPWLLAAAARVDPKTADAKEIIGALQGIRGSSPLFASARFRAAILLMDRGELREAAGLLDETLGRNAFDAATSNSLHAARFRAAATFEEALRYAARTEVYEENPAAADGAGKHALFDGDAATLFDDRLPLSLWRRALEVSILPDELRARVAQSGWTRAVLTGRNADWFATELVRLKPSYAGMPRGGDGLAAPLWMLRHAELNPNVAPNLARGTTDAKIDDFRRNWWCADSDARTRQFPMPAEVYSAGATLPVGYLSGEQAAENASEHRALAEAGAGPGFLSRRVVAWARAHPGDSRNAEALALAVKTSHFGCFAGENGKLVEAAFRLLHEKYGETDWAKRTPYWYDY